VALHPQYNKNHVIYLSYSKAGENNLTTTALARGTFDGTSLKDVKDIFVANSWSKSNTNFGGRIAFDRAGLLYLTVGERQEQDRAQKPGDHGGKVLRLRDDGSVPPDNPFVGKQGYMPEIYSLGHRSPQGLAMNPATGALWENEHGPLGGDELNIIQAGKNYGWPLVTFGTDYDGTKISDSTWRADLEAPFVYWVPSIAVSGLTFYTGDRFPQWKGNLFVGGHGTLDLVRLTLDGEKIVGEERLLKDLTPKPERIRDVRTGPDGAIYVLTDSATARLLKLVPKK
jgi:glucose/arabinose dehydrogenase